MNQMIQVAAMLVVTLATNEVKIGTATIGSDTFDVVGLQVVTNRVISIRDESWTNAYAGPFIGTNLVNAPAPVIWGGTNIWMRTLIPSNWIYTIPAINQN